MKIDFEKSIKLGVEQAMKECELTIGMTLKEAVEKQIPKAPIYEGDGYAPDGSFVYDTWICPSCGEKYEIEYDDYDYCPNCGQAILHDGLEGETE